MIITDRPSCDWHDQHWPTTMWLTWSSLTDHQMTDMIITLFN